MWMEKANNFSKTSASGCCLAFAWFWANFNLVLLIKVLLIKKSVYVIRLIICSNNMAMFLQQWWHLFVVSLAFTYYLYKKYQTVADTDIDDDVIRLFLKITNYLKKTEDFNYFTSEEFYFDISVFWKFYSLLFVRKDLDSIDNHLSNIYSN